MKYFKVYESFYKKPKAFTLKVWYDGTHHLLWYLMKSFHNFSSKNVYFLVSAPLTGRFPFFDKLLALLDCPGRHGDNQEAKLILFSMSTSATFSGSFGPFLHLSADLHRLRALWNTDRWAPKQRSFSASVCFSLKSPTVFSRRLAVELLASVLTGSSGGAVAVRGADRARTSAAAALTAVLLILSLDCRTRPRFSFICPKRSETTGQL